MGGREYTDSRERLSESGSNDELVSKNLAKYQIDDSGGGINRFLGFGNSRFRLFPGRFYSFVGGPSRFPFRAYRGHQLLGLVRKTLQSGEFRFDDGYLWPGSRDLWSRISPGNRKMLSFQAPMTRGCSMEVSN